MRSVGETFEIALILPAMFSIVKKLGPEDQVFKLTIKGFQIVLNS